MADFLQTLTFAITLGSLYALIALGYTMVYGILKLINFAHSDVVVVGAWSSLVIATFLLPRLGVDLKVPPWWAAVLVLGGSMLICAALGLAIERLAYKPIRKAPRLNALITAMGVSLLLQNAGQLQYSVVDGVSELSTGTVTERDTDPKRVKLDKPIELAAGRQHFLQIKSATSPVTLEREVTAAPGMYDIGKSIVLKDSVGKSQAQGAAFTLITRSTALKLPFGKMPGAVPTLISSEPIFTKSFTATTTNEDGSTSTFQKRFEIGLVHVVIVATAIALMVALQLLIYRTKLGTAMRAVSFNTDYAALMGVPIDRVISITFVIGAILAAAAGFLYGQLYGQLQQPAHFAWVLLGLNAFVAAVVGGIGNVRGATVGGFLIAFIEQFGGLYGTALFKNASAYNVLAVFVLLIVVLIVKPSGLFGSTAREKV